MSISFFRCSFSHKKLQQGITSRPCPLRLHISASNFSILAYEFSLHILISKDNYQVESNIIKFHKHLYAKTGKLEGFKYVGVQDRALKL